MATTLSDLICEEWCKALKMAYKHAKAERRAVLRGEIWRRYDQQGMHSYTAEWGRVFACEVLLPDLAQLRAEVGGFMGPVAMRREAEEDANREYAKELIEPALDELAVNLGH